MSVSARIFAQSDNLLQVTIHEGVSELPANTQEDDHVFEMPPTEQCRPFSGHDTPYQISSIAFATEPFFDFPHPHRSSQECRESVKHRRKPRDSKVDEQGGFNTDVTSRLYMALWPRKQFTGVD